MNETEMDTLMEGLLQQKFDQDLRTRWQSKLEKEHGITREGMVDRPARTNIRTLIRPMVAAAASIALLIFAINFFSLDPNSSQDMALAYLDETEMFHPGSVKGIATDEENRTQAIMAFNHGDYMAAFDYFGQLSEPTEEDQYYQALAGLKAERYTQATDLFRALEEDTQSYLQEVHWYLSLSLLLDGKNEEAVTELEKIRPNDWNYDKAQQLIDQLK